MKTKLSVGDLIIWNVDNSIAYITEIGNNESISVFYLDEPNEYYYTITQLSNYILEKELIHYPAIINSREKNEKQI